MGQKGFANRREGILKGTQHSLFGQRSASPGIDNFMIACGRSTIPQQSCSSAIQHSRGRLVHRIGRSHNLTQAVTAELQAACYFDAVLKDFKKTHFTPAPVTFGGFLRAKNETLPWLAVLNCRNHYHYTIHVVQCDSQFQQYRLDW